MFKHCLDCGKPLVTTVLKNQFGEMIDEIYWINENIFCKDCFINYLSIFGRKKGLSPKDVYFIIKEQKFYYDYNTNK